MNARRYGPVGDDAGALVRFGDAMTARTFLDAATTGERVSVVEHLLAPREWHIFWNAGDEQAQVLELISPGGFEKYFEEIGAFFPDDAPPDLEGMAAASIRYGLQMDFEIPTPNHRTLRVGASVGNGRRSAQLVRQGKKR